MFKTILVCLDGSRAAEEVLKYAADLASRYSSRVILFQAVPEAIFVSPGVSVRATAAVERNVRYYLDDVAMSLRPWNLWIECATARGEAGETIVRYAIHKGVDLIIMASQARTGLAHRMFGSITQHVLKESGVPMLIIGPPPGNHLQGFSTIRPL